MSYKLGNVNTSFKIADSFPKIIIERDAARHYYSGEGILVMGIMDFLLNEKSLDW